MAAKKKPIKVFAFIDTNIFLDFYRSQNETSLTLLKKLEGVKESVICTYQVEMEFLKNRQKSITDNISDKNLNIDSRLPAVMDDSNLNSILKRHKKDLDKRKAELKKRIGNIIGNPALYDPIYKTLEAIFSSENDHVLTRDMKIRHKVKRLAWRRFILGYPPRKSTDTSIGDALNWEWFIHCAKSYPGKYVIVSRDSDFGATYNNKSYLNDALKAEFRDRVGKKSIVYTTKLSEALKMMEVPVTPDEEKVEAEQLVREAGSAQLSDDMERRAKDTIEELLKMFGDSGEENS